MQQDRDTAQKAIGELITVASKGWSDIKKALQDWHEQFASKAAEQVKQDANRLQQAIVKEIQGTSKNKTEMSNALESKTNISSEAKEAMLAPSNTQDSQPKADGPDSMSLYANSIIIDDETSGTNVVHVVKLDDMRKKDETTGMTLDKLAKAIEFGTTRSAPHPAWRRSLNKLAIQGVYKKKQ